MSLILDFYHKDTIRIIVLMLPFIHLIYRMYKLTILPLIEFYKKKAITRKANINNYWNNKDETSFIPWRQYYVIKLTCYKEALHYLDVLPEETVKGTKVTVTYLPKSKLIINIQKEKTQSKQ